MTSSVMSLLEVNHATGSDLLAETPTPQQPPPSLTTGPATLAAPEHTSAQLDWLQNHVRGLEEAVLTLAEVIGRHQQTMAGDVDDIVSHQSMAIRGQLNDLITQLQTPPPLSRSQRRRAARAERREVRHTTKASKPARERPAGRRYQVLIPSLFLLAGLIGGAAVGLAPYETAGERCDGPLASMLGAVREPAKVSLPTEQCERAAADRMLLATVPALGGVMAGVAIVVMRDNESGRSRRRRNQQVATA
ncbi:MAG: hypothetical protein ACR2H3_09400 [Acidimicrobiales bacterium]